MSSNGPVLIDWTNQRIGPRGLDRAVTWMVLACFGVDDEQLRELERVNRLVAAEGVAAAT